MALTLQAVEVLYDDNLNKEIEDIGDRNDGDDIDEDMSVSFMSSLELASSESGEQEDHITDQIAQDILEVGGYLLCLKTSQVITFT